MLQVQGANVPYRAYQYDILDHCNQAPRQCHIHISVPCGYWKTALVCTAAQELTVNAVNCANAQLNMMLEGRHDFGHCSAARKSSHEALHEQNWLLQLPS